MKFLLIFLFQTLGLISFGQTPEYLLHIKSIRQNESHRTPSNCSLSDSTFLDYAISNIIKPNELKYISNKLILTSLIINGCSKWFVEMNDSIQGKSIKVVLKTSNFDNSINTIVKYEDPVLNHINENINGFIPYGAHYGAPKTQWTALNIWIDDQPLSIPDSVFSNLYEPNFCEFIGFIRNVKVYSSLDGQFLYLYVFGGNAADTYFAKLIFDHEKFIAKWVVDYYPLSCYGCFHDRFIGY